MAGSSERVNVAGGEVELFDIFQETELCFDFESWKCTGKKLKCLFIDFVKVFVEDISDILSVWSLPPAIGERQEDDFLRVYVLLRFFGVLKNESLDSDYELKSRYRPGLESVYLKYLRKIANYKEEEKTGFREKGFSCTTVLMELKPDPDVFILGAPNKMKNPGKFMEFEKKALDDGEEYKEFTGLSVDERRRNTNKGAEVNAFGKQFILRGDTSDNCAKDKDSVSRKRKRESYFDMLNWIVNVAKNPCDPSIGSLPERHKWKNYGSELQWKKILLVRDAMRLNTIDEASSQQSVWQNKQKMHPSMFDDQCVPEKLRCSKRLITAKDSSLKTRDRIGSQSSSSGFQSDEDFKPSDSTADSVGFWSSRRKKQIRVGSLFQADLPEFNKAEYQCDSKWLGTRSWPLDKGEYNRSLIERDPIGKGRQEACGCQIPGSPECVRFHIREKRTKVKLELGPAFNRWKFDGMGEEVAFSWTKEDENKFQDIVKSNRVSCNKYFWEELFKFFPHKGREALVSYYFNVFLLRQRGQQNRNNTGNIDSDDEESQFGPIGNRFGQVAAIPPGSIFCSPKKSHLNNR